MLSNPFALCNKIFCNVNRFLHIGSCYGLGYATKWCIKDEIWLNIFHIIATKCCQGLRGTNCRYKECSVPSQNYSVTVRSLGQTTSWSILEIWVETKKRLGGHIAFKSHVQNIVKNNSFTSTYIPKNRHMVRIWYTSALKKNATIIQMVSVNSMLGWL